MKKVAVSFLILFLFLVPVYAEQGLPPVVVPEPPYDGCVLHLPFEEGSGNITYNAVDPSVNNGTLGNGMDFMPTWTTGKFGKALSFDGVDDYVKVPDSESLDITDGLTVIAWVKGSGFVVSKGVYGILSSDKAYDIEVYNGKVRLWLVKGGVNWIWESTTEIDTTKFNQIAFTFKSPKIRIYINGNLDSEKTDSDVCINPNTLYLIIGRSHFANDFRYFNGIIDEVLIFNRALSDEEIKLLYQLGASHKFADSPQLLQIETPRISITAESETFNAPAIFNISTTNQDALIPIPANSIPTDFYDWAYSIDGKVLEIDDNRYLNVSSAQVMIPLRIETHVTKEIPQELILDEDKSYDYIQKVAIKNPSDIPVLATLVVPSSLAPEVYLSGARMVEIDGEYVSPVVVGAGEEKCLEISTSVSLAKQEVEYKATPEDFKSIESFNQAETLVENVAEGKIETVAKVVRIDASGIGDRTVVLPLNVRKKEVIEARALTGSKELLEIREGRDGAEVVVPSTAFEGPEDAKTAEVKILYQKKSSIFDKFGLSSLSSLFDKIMSILHLGG